MNITKLNKELEAEGYYVMPIKLWKELTNQIWNNETRIKELIKSRDNWREKYLLLKKENNNLNTKKNKK